MPWTQIRRRHTAYANKRRQTENHKDGTNILLTRHYQMQITEAPHRAQLYDNVPSYQGLNDSWVYTDYLFNCIYDIFNLNLVLHHLREFLATCVRVSSVAGAA